MKKLIIILSVVFFATTGFSQTASDIFKANDLKVYWLGIDFTQAKFIGEFNEFYGAGDKNEFELRDIFFPAWNNLVLNEPDKYDIKAMMKKDNFVYDIDNIMNLNSQAAPEVMSAYNTPNYTLDDIQSFVNKYTFTNFEGVGVAFIVESFNKPAAQAVIHIAIIDMETQLVLIHQKVIATPRGFGLRNYWAGAVYDAIKKVNKTYYKKWKAEYSE